MLQCVLGRAASGKTYETLKRISECVKNSDSPILLVPEQFSFESEKAVLSELGDFLSQKVNVTNFSRLCEEVQHSVGGICGKTLTESDKIILINKAIKDVSPNLKLWKNYANSSGFASSMLDTVNEFKINAVYPQDLHGAAEQLQGTNLANKLYDISLIYSAFNTLIGERFIDPSDRLAKLYDTLENYRFFENKTVFIDSFKGFTGEQFKILDRIIAQAKDVYITLTDDADDKKEFSIFSNVRKTSQKIKKLAKSHNVTVCDDIVLRENHYYNKDLSMIERLMAGKKDFKDGTFCKNVTVCKAESIFDETEFCARNIRRIVRENPEIRYRDFVVIARDTADYEQVLYSACEKNKVKCFIDRRIPLSAMPIAVSVLSATDTAKSFTTENILRFHKSGIGVLSYEEISLLENYTYLWNIKGSMWEKDWDMNPAGFVSEFKEKDTKALKKINELRKTAVTPLLNFKNSFKGSSKDMARAIVKLLDECNANTAFLKLYGEYKKEENFAYADAVSRSYDMVMDILDSIVNCFGDGNISKQEFCDAIKVSVMDATVGIAPQTLDEVTFGSADRIRPSRPKYAFILGANQGVFPRALSQKGIFKGNEREKLIEIGIEIQDLSLSTAIDEDFLVYTNVCCPTHGLFISYYTNGNTGNECMPSAFVTDILLALDCNKVCEPDSFNKFNLPETKETAVLEFCKRYLYSNGDADNILKAFENSDEFRKRINTVLKGAEKQKFSLTPDTAKKLFGENIRMSPSKFDNFNRCKFMYFCRDGLKLSRLQPADFDAMQRGTLIHFVLQMIIEKYGKNISLLADDEISKNVRYFTESYLDGIKGYRSVEDAHSKYLVSTIVRSLEYIVKRLRDEFAQSDFEPVKCELKIGANADIPEISIPIDDIGSISVSGIVDRLDSWNGYVRIIDYKTGHRDFKLPDILFGQNMQMLIYLYAVSKNGIYGNNPAGIFYMPARRIKNGKPADRRMSGLLADDKDLIYAMEKENKGEFIPKLTAKSSDSYIKAEDFDDIFDYIERKLKLTGKQILNGDIYADPVDGIDSPACKYCDFASVCRIEDTEHKQVPKIHNTQVLELIKKEAEENGI